MEASITNRVEKIYKRHIRSLPVHEQQQLLELIERDLATQSALTSSVPKHSIMELHGLGKEIWKGIDAQEYVNKLRKEWDHRP